MNLFTPYEPPTDTDGNPLPDPCARKHQGSQESQAAFARVEPTIRRSWEDILGWLAVVGNGTAKQYAAARGKAFNCISGRWAELKQQRRIEPTGERRDGAAVYRLAERE